jgi:hypothetical protein
MSGERNCHVVQQLIQKLTFWGGAVQWGSCIQPSNGAQVSPQFHISSRFTFMMLLCVIWGLKLLSRHEPHISPAISLQHALWHRCQPAGYSTCSQSPEGPCSTGCLSSSRSLLPQNKTVGLISFPGMLPFSIPDIPWGVTPAAFLRQRLSGHRQIHRLAQLQLSIEFQLTFKEYHCD